MYNCTALYCTVLQCPGPEHPPAYFQKASSDHTGSSVLTLGGTWGQASDGAGDADADDGLVRHE